LKILENNPAVQKIYYTENGKLANLMKYKIFQIENGGLENAVFQN